MQKSTQATLSFVAAFLFFLGGVAEFVARTPSLGGLMFLVSSVWVTIGFNFKKKARQG